jgi:hypothetical protein
MLRNVGIVLFMISYVCGCFHNVPYILLLLLCLVAILDSVSFYVLYKNTTKTPSLNYLRNLSTIYRNYNEPFFNTSPVLFTIDRLVFSLVMLYLMYYLLFKYPNPF